MVAAYMWEANIRKGGRWAKRYQEVMHLHLTDGLISLPQPAPTISGPCGASHATATGKGEV